MIESGHVIDGRYRLDAKIGEGGMGAVWRARHLELDVDVALKVMLADESEGSQGEWRFRREARAAAKLQSPHVVRVLDFGAGDGRLYLAMELLEGEDCAARLARGPLPAREVAGLLDEVAAAVDLAHAHGIVHRDLKPANLFLAREHGRVVAKVLDFGIAKIAGASSGKTTGAGFVGSPAYMSPEQVWGEPTTSASDIWSLGVVAFELLTGECPFEAAAVAKTFERILRGELPSPRASMPALPAALDDFFARAFERDPAQRFPSASALAEAFRGALDEGEGTAAPHVVAPRVVAARDREADPSARTVAAPRPARSSTALVVVGLLIAGAAALALGWWLRPPNGGAAPAAPTTTEQPPSASPVAREPKEAPSASATAQTAASTTASAVASASASAAPSVHRSQPVRASAIAKPATAKPPPKPSARPVDPRFGVPRGQ